MLREIAHMSVVICPVVISHLLRVSLCRIDIPDVEPINSLLS